jgi:hypothetical protein
MITNDLNQSKNIFPHIEYASSEISEKTQENNNELAINGTSDLEVNSEDKDLGIPENDIPDGLEKRGGGKRGGSRKGGKGRRRGSRKGKRRGSRKGGKRGKKGKRGRKRKHRKHKKRGFKNISNINI